MTTTAPGPMSTQEAYRVLGLTPPVTEREVRRAFRRLVQTTHPDVASGSTEAFQQAGAAREVLLDGAKAAEAPPPPPPSSPPPPPREPPPSPSPPHGAHGPSEAAQCDAERRAQGGGPWDLGTESGADTGPLFRPVAERIAAPRTWRVDLPLAAVGVLGYALLLGLSLLVSSTALVVTAASAAVLLLGSVVWSALGRVRRLPDGWPRVGAQRPDDEVGDGP